MPDRGCVDPPDALRADPAGPVGERVRVAGAASLHGVRCLACGRDLAPQQRALVGYWPTVRALLWWLLWDEGDGAGPDVRAVWVCRGRCGDPGMRQRIAAEACAGRVGR